MLIVDEDPGTQEMLVSYFRQQNLDAVCASDRNETLRQLAADPCAVILDLRFGEDGLDLLREIRSRSDVPVIIATGDHHDDIDRIVGLELGADDCLTKPFNPRELLARVRAVLRRQEMARSALPSRSAEHGGFRFDGWQLMRQTRHLTDRQGETIPLTKGEWALLVAFLEAPGRILSREYLVQATRMHDDVFDRTVDVQVMRLRQKLESVPAEPRHVLTERGVGYVFATPVERF